ncbi:MAG: rRNA maturation RNase YbeY [Gemmatimonas sp.]|uniref:rRNA maturation RNase YbeY n=1 Tax=Gemmatimonas sp. UBA7669 TaxID=1946568 RepID=UPI0025C23276|nr:rRNA maturation RNase YbeY [Gemmatimonas sp. UBA7669]MBA3918152.1 rRNA maturation RNase YbeY [Gemmatimonas sp.]
MSPAVRRAAPPTRVVDISLDGVRLPVATARLEALSLSVLRALRVPKAMLSVTFVTSRRMATLNKRHLGHSGPTDVITFALGTDPVNGVTGDIYICPDVARAQAKSHGVGVREELARLVVHGTLHACGFEHPEDERRTSSPMWRRQEQLLQRFWITPTPGA